MSDRYRPAPYSSADGQPSDEFSQSYDRPGFDRARVRDFDRDFDRDYDHRDDRYNSRDRYDSRDHYDSRDRYRSRSPRGDWSQQGRSSSRVEDQYARSREVGYYHDRRFSQSDALNYLQGWDGPTQARDFLKAQRHTTAEYDMYAEPAQPPPYHGENDVSPDGRPLHLLLVRNLKENLTEEVFAKGLEKLNQDPDNIDPNCPPSGATLGSLRRVLIIRDRQTDMSMRFGYAEYHDRADATRALAKAEELDEKCTIGSRKIAVSCPHFGVFPPVVASLRDRTGRQFTFNFPTSDALHKYHDDRYYPRELMVNAEAPSRPNSSGKESASGSDRGLSIKGAATAVYNYDADSALNAAKLETKEKSKKRKAPGTTAPAFLQHWQNKAAELRRQEERAEAGREREELAKANKASASGPNALNRPAIPVESDEQTFSIDTAEKKCCYLCAAQFQTSEGLQRHLKESAKHAGNAKDDAATAKGYERLVKANVDARATIKLLLPSDVVPADSSYRDRAAERRSAQQTATGFKEATPKFSLKNNKLTGRKPSSSPAPAPPSYGKGLGMLQKAGWSPGQGLGAGERSGPSAPIEQNLYSARVGLGHEAGKLGDAVSEAARLTVADGREDFLEKTREKARERFGKME
ncbi:hypothetical protein LTR62_004614 [Meristemomyces frigidus]|uniref:G-patch domain-containing protein n=1 Tax=Meristemomyces frigidus TaxID=1508187 RepID=A0AAN7TEB5_9PEZI|nr:hypothetical protein LTR62_004614 [Meristemomyces frigidus]